MRLVSLQQLVSTLLLLTAVADALPSKPRAVDPAVEKRGMERNLQRQKREEDITVDGVLPKAAHETVDVEKRGPGPYAIEESNDKEYEMLDDDNDYGHHREQPTPVEPDDLEKRSLEEERTLRKEHSAKVRRENIKRLYQEVSALQEYRTRIPPAAYAADDGSFGHSITHRDTTFAEHVKRAQAESQIRSHFDRRRSVLIERLKELGYDPDKLGSYSGTDLADPNKRLKLRREILDAIGKRGAPESGEKPAEPAQSTKPVKVEPSKRDIQVHIGCPSLRLMNSVSLTFFNPDSFKDDMFEFRNRCFNCGCQALDRGWFLIERPDYMCTKQLIQSCYIMGCMCTEQLSADSHFLVGRPMWKPGDGKGQDATFQIDQYDPGRDETYGDGYAAEVIGSEEILKKTKRDHAHVARDEPLDATKTRLDFNNDVADIPRDSDKQRNDGKPDLNDKGVIIKRAPGPTGQSSGDITRNTVNTKQAGASTSDEGGWVPVVDKRAGAASQP
ncbi:hypothetical protein Dda_1078 [Drechslerella dactyloides]|uniref:Uncharacterized protein n=1 Tax=Drechslerella dactyloides TaxID=74499 RepID=A0AAD6NNW1_DREDA|nr:hypothetical protein Dda_1078 [Drechslerella dactyloides]